MARPKKPLISKRKALEVALDIIDSEGIASLSIRRLADRLNVNGASLYHHFRNKDEIVVGAATLALKDVRVPQSHDELWRVWMVSNARRLREACLMHPDLVPTMLRRQPLGIGAAQLDATVARLEEDNVPLGAIIPMLEALELFAIGSALSEVHPNAGEEGDGLPGSDQAPNLSRASSERALTPAELFDLACDQIVNATVMAALEKRLPRPAPSRTTRPRIVRESPSPHAASV